MREIPRLPSPHVTGTCRDQGTVNVLAGRLIRDLDKISTNAARKSPKEREKARWVDSQSVRQ